MNDRKASLVPSTCPDIPKNAPFDHKTRFFYNSQVQPAAVEAALARRSCVSKKVNKCVWGKEYWARGKPGGDRSVLVSKQNENEVGSHVTDKLGTGSGQGEMSNNASRKDRDATCSSLGVEFVLMRHSTRETPLDNIVGPGIMYSGQ